MFETITKFAVYLEHVTFFTYPITIFLGFMSGMAAITCCMPLVPAIAGFVGTQDLSRKRLLAVPFFMMLGSIVILVILGLVASFAGLAMQSHLVNTGHTLLG